MRSVLVGVDDSDGARAASIMGSWLSDRLGLDLVLAHVRDDEPSSPYGDAVHRERVRHRSGRRAMALLNCLGPPTARRRVGSGQPADTLATLAGKEAAALIVIGSRGHGSLRSLFSRSVSRSLARQADCPVVVLPPPAFERVLRLDSADARPAVVCGVEGHEEAAETASVAAELADSARLDLTLAGAGSSVREAEGGPAEVKRVALERDAVLIAVGTNRRGRFRRAVLGSVPAMLASSAPCPVLVVPPGVNSIFGSGARARDRQRA